MLNQVECMIVPTSTVLYCWQSPDTTDIMVSLRVLAALLGITHLTKAVDITAPPLPPPSGGLPGNLQEDAASCQK